jgi:hypothetical protein
MLEELRLNPRSPKARSGGRVWGERALTEDRRGNRGLSTGFAEPGGTAFHNSGSRPNKEGVVA